MKKVTSLLVLLLLVLASCSEYQTLYKSSDYEYKYEAAKQFYTQGDYMKCYTILNEVVSYLKGSDKGEDAAYMIGMAFLRDGDYDNATASFRQYYLFYPRGTYAELCRFYSGKAQYLNVPEFELDQTSTYTAISELQVFIEYYPDSPYRAEAESMVFELQDHLARKEYGSAKLYYDLGTYLGNNYLSCIVTAQNALKEYPYTKYREDLSILVVRAMYAQSRESHFSVQGDRFRQTLDECYAFKNEFDQSQYLEEVDDILAYCEKVIEGLPVEE